MAKKDLSFENQMNRLQEIVSQMERGDLPLEEMLSIFEEGIKTYRKCHTLIEKAEAKIEFLTQNMTEDEDDLSGNAQ